MDAKNNRLTIQAWSDTRNIVRRVISVGAERRGRLELVVERFARNAGPMFLIDMDRPDSQETGRRGGRLVFRERFRRFLTREYPSWRLSEISAEPDLEHSLSPAFPRALLRKGNSGIAAISATPTGMDSAFLLSFGLIWLDYLRRREQRLAIERLVLFLPAGAEQLTCIASCTSIPSACVAMSSPIQMKTSPFASILRTTATWTPNWRCFGAPLRSRRRGWIG